MKTFVVFGSNGFIGSHIVDTLIKGGYKVVIIDNLSLGKKENINPKAGFYKRDIRNLKSILPFFKNVDGVFHLAAQPRIQPSIKDPLTSFDHNVRGTLNVFWAAKVNNVPRVVYSASSSAYGDQDTLPLHEGMVPKPTKNPYALFKYMGEELGKLFLELYQLPVVTLRYFNVYGERQSNEGAYATVIGVFLRQKKNGQQLTIVGDGEQERDFTYVKDVARANLLAMGSRKAVGELINIGAGQKYTINEVAHLVEHEHTFIPPRPGETRVTLADNSKAERILGWKPTMTLERWIKSVR